MFTTAAIDGLDGGCNLRAMKCAALALLALLGLTGCDVQWAFSTSFKTHGLNPKRFELAGKAYQWSLMGLPGGTRLLLTRLDRGTGGPVVFTLSCTDPGYGGLSLAMGEPSTNRLSLQAGRQTFAVDAIRKETDGLVRAAGEGYFPDGWAKAIGAADQVVVTHGAQRWTFEGPGKPLAGRFARFCWGRR